MTPTWIFDLLAAVMLAVAAVSATRFAAAWAWRREAVFADADVAHLLMAIAMAGMLTTSLLTFRAIVWEIVFGALIAWFAFRGLRDARVNGIRALAGECCAPPLLHSGAMLYMFLATTSVAGMAGMSGMNEMPGSSGSTMLTLNDPTLAFVFTILLIGYAVWDLDRLSGGRYRRAGASAAERAPGVSAAGIPAMAGAESLTATLGGQQAPAGPVGPVGPVGPAASGGTGEAAPPSQAAKDPVVEFLLSPAITVGCGVAMGATMAFILVIAI